MNRRRVLILYLNSLLAEGLLALLSQESWLEVRAKKLTDCLVTDAANHFVPDVIIVDRDELAGQTAITIGDLLSGDPGTRVIDVSIRNTKVRLYEGREFSEANFGDLLAAIKSDRPTISGSIQPPATPKGARRGEQFKEG